MIYILHQGGNKRKENMQKQLRNIAAIYITAVTHTRVRRCMCIALATPISLKSSQNRNENNKKLYANAAQ